MKTFKQFISCSLESSHERQGVFKNAKIFCSFSSKKRSFSTFSESISSYQSFMYVLTNGTNESTKVSTAGD
jgi:hypothetical protein